MNENIEAKRRHAGRGGRRQRADTGASQIAEALSHKRIIGRGGTHSPLDDAEVAIIHDTAITLLAETGLSEPSKTAVNMVTAAGGFLDDQHRLRFPETLVSAAIAGLRRDIKLLGRGGDTDLDLAPGHVFVGTGGASPLVYDSALGKYRESGLSDLYDAACLVDQLNHIHFFSRPLVARDMPDMRHLDVNTAYACLAGTRKHAFISASTPASVRDIAQICYQLAGSKDAFCQRPFLSINVNHVVPPMRFDSGALVKPPLSVPILRS